jgi:SAM-dependent methyltransferase
VAERWKARGVGVDINPAFLADAARRAAGHVPDGAIEWIRSPVAEARLAPASFDLAILVGSTHAFGDLATALRSLRGLVRPRGQVLLGHGYWKRPPDPEYLAGFGASRDELGSHDDLLSAADLAGFEPLASTLSSPAEWDAYEDPYAANIERFCAEHPGDPDRDAMLERIRNWRRLYQRWGRDTLGFGLYRLRSRGRV